VVDISAKLCSLRIWVNGSSISIAVCKINTVCKDCKLKHIIFNYVSKIFTFEWLRKIVFFCVSDSLATILCPLLFSFFILALLCCCICYVRCSFCKGTLSSFWLLITDSWWSYMLAKIFCASLYNVIDWLILTVACRHLHSKTPISSHLHNMKYCTTLWWNQIIVIIIFYSSHATYVTPV